MYVCPYTGLRLKYRISSIRRRGCLFRCSFCAATILGRLLFEGGVYSLESLETSTTAG